MPELDEDGLTAEERTYLGVPFGQLSPDQRQVALAIKDKLSRNRWSANERYRTQKSKETQDRFREIE